MNSTPAPVELTAEAARTDQPDAAVRTAFWNVQNLFDISGSAMAAELEFTPVCGWDQQALEVRLQRLAEIIRQMFDGQGPDLLGLCEVENTRVAERLIREIGRSDYRLAAAVPPPGHSLDTVLIYSDRVFELQADGVRGHSVDPRFPTLNILEVPLRVRANQADLLVLVNHWPSRRPGRLETLPLRLTAASCCRRLVHAHLKVDRREYLELRDNDVSLFRLNTVWNRNLLLMGDFNDEPWSDSVLETLGAGFSSERMEEAVRMQRGTLPSWKLYSSRPVWLFNPMWPLAAVPDQGTCASSSTTQGLVLRDQLILSRGLYLGQQGLQLRERTPGLPDVRIFRPEQMTTRKGRPREFRLDDHSGYSDHFPITATLQPVSW